MEIIKTKYLQLLLVVILSLVPVFFSAFEPYSFWFLIITTVIVFIFMTINKNEFIWITNFKNHFKLKTLVKGVLYGIIFWLFIDVILTPIIESLFMVDTDYSRFEVLRNNLPLTLKLILSIWLSAAFCEEIIFRGYLLEVFKKISNKKGLAILFSSVLFGIMHYYQGPSGILITTIAGFIFGYIYVKSNYNLFLLFTIHGIADSIFFINIYTGLDKIIMGKAMTVSILGASVFNIPVNEKAPVYVKQQIIIEAQPSKVWQSLTDINKWPEWQENVVSAHLNGDFKEGTTFDWKAGGLSFSSKIHTCKPLNYFGWTGKTIGASAIHNWTIKPIPNGTLVEVEESLDGLFPRLFSSKFKKDLIKGMQKNLIELKKRSLE